MSAKTVAGVLRACWDYLESQTEMVNEPDSFSKRDLESHMDFNDKSIYDTTRKFLNSKKFDQTSCHRTAHNIIWAFAEDANFPDDDDQIKNPKEFRKYLKDHGYEMWNADAAERLARDLKKYWDDLNEPEKDEEDKKPGRAGKATGERGSLKTRVFVRAKEGAKKVLVRKVSRKLVGNVHVALVKQLAASPKTRQVSVYLDNPMGEAIISGLLAVGLETMPLPEYVRDALEPIKDDLVEEITLQAFDQATVPAEKMMALLLPSIKDAIKPLLGAKELLQLAEKND